MKRKCTQGLMTKRMGNHCKGYSLVELLVAVSILGSLIAAGAYLVSHLLFDSRIGLKQKAIDDWGRIDYIIETDVREGIGVTTGSGPVSGSCTGKPDVAITIATTISGGNIVYYNGTQSGVPAIRRCGPNVLPDGRLSATGSSDNALALNTRISGDSPTGNLVDYEVEFTALGITEKGYARPRSRAY